MIDLSMKYLHVKKVTKEKVYIEVKAKGNGTPIAFYENLGGAQGTDCIEVTRGDDHVALFSYKGEEGQTYWGPSGTDTAKGKTVELRNEIKRVVQEAGVNLEVATLDKPLRTVIKFDGAFEKFCVTSIYPEPVGTHKVPLRFKTEAEAEAFKASLEAGIPSEFLSVEDTTEQTRLLAQTEEEKELPEEYVNDKIKEERKAAHRMSEYEAYIEAVMANIKGN